MVVSRFFTTSWLGLFETPITAVKRKIGGFPKLPSATPFILGTLSEMSAIALEKIIGGR